METKQSVFNQLNAIDCNDHTEKKDGLTYLSWAWSWAEVKKIFPNAAYKVFKDEKNRPYIEDEDFGLMVFTSVTMTGQWDDTLEMWLPVMNSSNKAMRRTPYDIIYNTKVGEKKVHVDAATMFDINKTIMRCLVKNLAMFGLGLYIYAGEDLPEEAVKQGEEQAFQSTLQKIADAKTDAEVCAIWTNNVAYQSKDEFRNAVINRRQQLKAA